MAGRAGPRCHGAVQSPTWCSLEPIALPAAGARAGEGATDCRGHTKVLLATVAATDQAGTVASHPSAHNLTAAAVAHLWQQWHLLHFRGAQQNPSAPGFGQGRLED